MDVMRGDAVVGETEADRKCLKLYPVHGYSAGQFGTSTFLV
jgi:hypothetical protein